MRAARITPFPNGELGVVWEDGHESYYPGHDLRCACGCAECVEETSGRKLLQDDQVPRDVRIVEMHPVGNYAIGVRWSDGHETGIYPFDRLRALCPCC
jgi:ATP-binding protein involved in chromosome partitioning